MWGSQAHETSHRNVSSKRLKNFENEKLFFCLEIAEIDRESQFWVEKNDSGHKSLVFSKLNPFSVVEYLNPITHSLLERGKLVTSFLQKVETIPNSNFASGMVLRPD